MYYCFHMWIVAQLSQDLAADKITSRDLIEEALSRIGDTNGEGKRAFLKVYSDTARIEADFSDRLRRAGIRRSPVDGLPVSLKDLFDVSGDVTRAASNIRADAAPAERDAAAVARLRAAGAVIIGRTHMVEFAFGGVGLNAHFETPRNPWDRGTGRIPGGSTSGGAVAQADGMCVMALGSDTRGSVRQPAALCGVAGFKPTTRRVPREGAFPLSYTLDSVGPLANSVACCATYDAILAGERPDPSPLIPAKGLRLLLPISSALEDLDSEVAKSFEASVLSLRKAGAFVREVPVPAFDRQSEYFKGGGLAGAEAYHVHQPYLHRLSDYDPRVGKRIILGKEMSAAEYVGIARLRDSFISEIERVAAPFDAIIMPTTPCIAPTIAETERSDEDYFRWNFRIMRNTGLINFLDGCAATVPCHEPGNAPVGFMVCGIAGTDRHTLAVAAGIEREIRRI
jgi:aspartyl-tRNA(Asn)/glutamyl-tRNA(Gln) amidotransferase subunit A